MNPSSRFVPKRLTNANAHRQLRGTGLDPAVKRIGIVDAESALLILGKQVNSCQHVTMSHSTVFLYVRKFMYSHSTQGPATRIGSGASSHLSKETEQLC